MPAPQHRTSAMLHGSHETDKTKENQSSIFKLTPASENKDTNKMQEPKQAAMTQTASRQTALDRPDSDGPDPDRPDSDRPDSTGRFQTEPAKNQHGNFKLLTGGESRQHPDRPDPDIQHPDEQYPDRSDPDSQHQDRPQPDRQHPDRPDPDRRDRDRQHSDRQHRNRQHPDKQRPDSDGPGIDRPHSDSSDSTDRIQTEPAKNQHGNFKLIRGGESQ